MMSRYVPICLIASLTVLAMLAELWLTLAPGGWTVARLTMMASGALAAPWVGFCAANGIAGFLLIMLRRPVPEPVLDPQTVPRTAIALTVRNEAMDQVLPAAGELLDGLNQAGLGHAFALFILSDTADPIAVAREEREVEAFIRAWPISNQIRYRRRADNAGFKAGNIMDFLDRLADGFELMLVLDADSRMTPTAVSRLIATIRNDFSLGTVQHLTVGLPASSAFPRLFQFGMRAGMRTWATSLSWWQDDSCVYWGHNAIIRIAPFREHCRLPSLPGGTPILSHDQVEAAILRGAGWGIRLLPEEDGSYEANPPALPEFMRRELRWMAGNFEYRHLLTMPGLRPMGRWQLIQAILLFGCTPFYVLFLLGSALAAATYDGSGFPLRHAMAATAIWAGGLYMPKLLGYLEILLRPGERARYGGAARIGLGILLESIFILALDAVNMLAKTVATLRICFGLRASWTPQNRGDRGVSWAEAARLLWPQTVLGVLVCGCFAHAGAMAVLWALPFAGGLVVAIPFCVLTANARAGAWLRARRLAAIPEELI